MAIRIAFIQNSDVSQRRSACFSKIKLVDVLLGEEERLAEQDVVALDLDLAEPAGDQSTSSPGLRVPSFEARRPP